MPVDASRLKATLLPRASAMDVLRGRSPLVGSRLDPTAARGLVSPVEARVHVGIPYGDLVAAERDALADLGAVSRVEAVLRALVARALSGADSAPAPEEAFVVSARFLNTTVEGALAAVLERPKGPHARLVHFVHPHSLNLAVFDREHRRRLAEAAVVLADGIGVRLAARVLGFRLRDNMCGTDLVPALLPRVVAAGRPLALVGGRPGVAEACAVAWSRAVPGVEAALCTHGYLGAEEIARLRERLRALEAPVVLVGMGSPSQEAWAHAHLADLPGVTVVTVGGLFDYFAGRVRRAPVAWREMGLEWLYRLLQEPRRLAARYLLGNPLFGCLVLAQRLRLLGRS